MYDNTKREGALSQSVSTVPELSRDVLQADLNRISSSGRPDTRIRVFQAAGPPRLTEAEARLKQVGKVERTKETLAQALNKRGAPTAEAMDALADSARPGLRNVSVAPSVSEGKGEVVPGITEEPDDTKKAKSPEAGEQPGSRATDGAIRPVITF